MHTKLETKNHTQKLCLSYRNPAENIKLTTKVPSIYTVRESQEGVSFLAELGKVRKSQGICNVKEIQSIHK